MRSILSTVFIASVLAVPVTSFAQNANGSLTRAEVQAQLVDAEQHGLLYGHTAPYPQSLSTTVSTATAPTAERRDSGYGAEASGSSQSGNPRSLGATQGLYSHH